MPFKEMLEDVFGKKNVTKGKKFFEDTKKGIENKIKTVNEYAKDHFYTDGKFDTEKVKDYLKHEAEVISVYGQKAIEEMKKVVGTTAGKLEDALEKMSIYEDRDRGNTQFDQEFGKDYLVQGKILFHSHYDKTKKFYDEAEKKIDMHESKCRKKILSDITRNAISDVDELIGFYDAQTRIVTNDPVTSDNLVRKKGEVKLYFDKY